MIVVRNGRDEAVGGVIVSVTGLDDSGATTFSSLISIEMALGPDEWAYGEAQFVPNLDRTTNFNVEFFDPGELGQFDVPVNLDVTNAELRDGVISGNIVNQSPVPVVDNIGVHVACFHDSQITEYQDAALSIETLHIGESASFTTTTPIDPTTCSSFAVYADGFPEAAPAASLPAPDVGATSTTGVSSTISTVGAASPVTSAPVPPAPTSIAEPLATTTTSAAPSTTVAASAGVTIVDDTNFLTVTVPVDWDEQQTFSGWHDDGSDRPQIAAAPNLQQFFETFTGSGLYIVAGPPTTEPAVVLAENDWTGVCSDGGVTPYDDGRFIGQQQTWSNCDGGTNRLVQIAVRPVDKSFTMFVVVAQAVPDDAQLLRVIASLGVVPGAQYPALMVPVPLVPTGAVSPSC